ncbi:zinc finger and BTB domain-containing protein 17 isoform X4 [Ochlerotatus camptorhynchus]|uniref:zinc finger and BTB domain-containing protein 17 isoform X4 n=1 Tax=Ochlerotatus camptorhynchus TaxID=644619 RepID=UPI0031DEAAC3
MQPDPSAYHCAICLLKRNPLDTLNGSTIASIIAQGRPTPALPGLSKECRYKGKVFTRRFKKDNYFRYNWLSGCGVENKLFCWPCYIFSTDPTDTWGFKGFDGLSNFSNSVKTHLNQELHILNTEKYNVYASDEHKIWSERLPMQQPSFTISRKKVDILPDLPMVAATNNYSEEADEDDDDVEVIRHSDVMVELVDDSVDGNAIFTGDSDSQTAASGAEKYQLKWHSHQQNLNSSISCLYKNDRYADVMLITCNSEENFAIPAHKLVLGTSSTYFANIFDKNFAPANAMTYIVLPPELTKRAIQTLIQYMYTGESTVSVDILNEVLRGGEILKIRGLWRNQAESSAHSEQQGSKDGSSRHRTERISVDRIPLQEPRIAQNPVTAHDSPVIVTNSAKSYGISQTAQMPASSSTPIINVKKDVAIDPGERSSRSQSQKRSFQELHQQAQRQQGSAQISACRPSPPNADNTLTPGTGTRSMPEELNFLSVKEEPVEWTDVNAEEINLDKSDMPMVKVELKEFAVADENHGQSQDQVYSPLTCELCSETFTVPAEWVRHIESHTDPPHTVSKRRRRIEDDDGADATAALKCDLCAMYFVTPAEWVRHVQSTHTETELAISNNSGYSRRSSKSTTSDPQHSAATTTAAGQQQEKSCSICNKSFPSYASMLIHKRTHTGERPFYCDICNKGFNVKSNLLRHMRTLHNQHGSQSPTSGGDSHGSD